MAFMTPVGLKATPFAGRAPRICAVTSRSGPQMVGASVAAAADVYIAESAIRELKAAGAPGGEYAVNCTEGAASGSAETLRVATLSREFRLRQASTGSRFADLFATRREALCASGGAHYAEASITKFPAAAAARALAGRESSLACDRYFGGAGVVGEYMRKAVVRQYAEVLGAPGGVYSRYCADGASKGYAEDARVASLATEYRVSMLSASQTTAARYNAIQSALSSARGCTYEEEQFVRFPKMAAAMKGIVTGSYAASVGGARAMGGTSSKRVAPAAPLAERLAGGAGPALWKNSDIRAAVPKTRKPWEKALVKDYSYMSQAAVAYGVEAQTDPYVDDKYHPDAWYPGWQPSNKFQKSY